MNLPDRMKRKRERRLELLKDPSPKLIPFGDPTTEFEVQAYLYGKLKEIGYLVRGEVRSLCLTCVFDIVVYRSDGNEVTAVRIIEVKKCKVKGTTRKSRRAEARRRGDQIDRYSLYGVPVDLVQSLREAKVYIERVKETPLY